jgi:hypothetical protein
MVSPSSNTFFLPYSCLMGQLSTVSGVLSKKKWVCNHTLSYTVLDSFQTIKPQKRLSSSASKKKCKTGRTVAGGKSGKTHRRNLQTRTVVNLRNSLVLINESISNLLRVHFFHTY